MVDCSYKITHEKEQDYWKLIEHGMTKDTSHRSYEFESRNWGYACGTCRSSF